MCWQGRRVSFSFDGRDSACAVSAAFLPLAKRAARVCGCGVRVGVMSLKK